MELNIKKIFLFFSVLLVVGGCTWGLNHQQVLTNSNDRLNFQVWVGHPGVTVYADCMGNFKDRPESEDPISYLNYPGATLFEMDRIDVYGNELDDRNGDYRGRAITTAETSAFFTDSAGVKVYQAFFDNIRVGGDTSRPGAVDECWTTSAYGMDNRGRFKAKLVFYYNAPNDGRKVYVDALSSAEAQCVIPKVANQGVHILTAYAQCNTPHRKVMHLYSNNIHTPTYQL